MVAVDEAHCCSFWGQDFRPSYLNIAKFVAELPNRPIITAFTATATDLVKDDIIRLLNQNNPFVRATGFNRENLYFEVRRPRDKFTEIKTYIEARQGQSGIIYCATRKTVDEITEKLQAIGISAARYHAGMGQNERSAAQQDFVFDRKTVMVATNAFGMGIDKSNVSFVIHYNMPKNLESYYQEAGRAGRDGSPADCILLFSRQDIMINQFLIDQQDPESTLTVKEQESVKARDYKRLREMEAYCNISGCLRRYILDYFGDTDPCYCDNCGNCNTPKEMVDITLDAQKILSCVRRMQGRFGLAMVIDVLRGSGNKKIVSANMDKLSTYGIMSGQPAEKIRQLAQYLIQEGYIETIGDRYPVVRAADKSWEVLQNQKTVIMPMLELQTEDKQISVSRKPVKSTAAYAVNEGLFIQLKELRMRLASEEKVPAFVVFSDAALYDMCAKLPATDDEFLGVSGVGNMKLQKYGQAFLEVICKFTDSGEEIISQEAVVRPSIAELAAEFRFSEEPIHLTDFMGQANMLLIQARGRGTARSVITKMLEQDNYLESRPAGDGKKSRLPTPKGEALGIEAREEESANGSLYLRNYYGPEAQRIMLGYIVEMGE